MEQPVQPIEPIQLAPVVPAKPKIQTGFTYLPLLCDLALRYVVYFAWREWHLPNWIFWNAQLVFIPILLFAWMGVHDDRLKAAFGVQSSQEWELKDAPGWIMFMLAMTVHNIVHGVSDIRIVSPERRLLAQFLMAFGAGFYTLMIGLISSTTERLDLPSEAYVAFDEVDENDRILTRLKAELDNLIRRVEAYTIESTLIGAISFAAFVTIVMSDKGRFYTAHNLLQSCLTAERNVGNVKNWHAAVQSLHYPTEATILVSVALTAVVCSLFFMGVIVARLRFSALVGAATFSTEMAAGMNEKENSLAGQGPGDAVEARNTRLAWLHGHVDQYLNEARVELDQLRPIIVYMTIFRTLGLLTFMVTLVLSALWFGPRTALCFAVVAILTYCYPWIDAFRDKRLRKTDFSRLRSIITAKLGAH